MTDGTIILVGGPASGKTNYIARLWLAFQAKKGKLKAEQLPDNIEYVNEAVAHLLDRKFAPRTEHNMEEGARRDFTVPVRGSDGAGLVRSLTVPDITGELWKRSLETYELPQVWIDALRSSSSAIIFIRANSKLNHQPMDWVTAREILKGHDDEDEDHTVDDDDDYGQYGPVAVSFRSFESNTRHQGDRTWQRYTATSSSGMQFASRPPAG